MGSKTNPFRWLTILIFAIAFTTSPIASKTIYVDDDAHSDPKPHDPTVSDPLENGSAAHPFDAIQEAIDAAIDGDKIVILRGTYGTFGTLWVFGWINFNKKNVVVQSENPDDPAVVADTVIDGEWKSAIFSITGQQGREMQIRGLTLRRGFPEGDRRAGAIYISNSHPTIANCVFEYNIGNWQGGAISCISSNPRIENCVFVGNTLPGGWGSGGAIYCSESNAEILHCTFTGNGAQTGGAIAIEQHGNPVIRNCILWGNASLSTEHSQIFVGNSTPMINYCDIENGTSQWWFGSGNIDIDPLLTADGCLRQGSPCIDAGTTILPSPAVTSDRHGDKRPTGVGVDMGADEYSDTDADGLPDFWEKKYFGDRTSADPVVDSDNDGLVNLKEYEAGTNPKVADTDGDHWDDAREVARGANPIGANVYVDGSRGDDVLDGRAPVHTGGIHGPKKTIQSAIVAAGPGETVIIASGIYSGSANYNLDFSAGMTSGGRTIAVQSENPFDPNVVAATVIDPEKKGRAFYFHDVHSPLACVQGLTLRNGLADSSTPGGACGGAVFCTTSSPTIADCTIKDNLAMDNGGGLCGCIVVPSSTIRIIDCNISGNEARKSGGGLASCAGPIINCSITDNSAGISGGGMYNDSNPPLINCTIARNTAGDGGGIYNMNKNTPTLTNCRITGNIASEYGGGMCSTWGTPKLENCILSGNLAGQYGGGMYNNGSSPTLWNCTFSENSAKGYGGGMCNWSNCNPTLTNCIFWGNIGSGQGECVQVYGGPLVVNYSCIQDWSGSSGGTGNIGSDPCFAEAGYWDSKGTAEDPTDDFWVEGDYHLKSQAGRWDPKTKRWVKDNVTSPCIDTGDPNSDWTAELWPHGKRINMDAYGGTPEASMSLSDPGNAADYNNDNLVDSQDLLILTQEWLANHLPLAADINRDARVDWVDFAIMALHWLEGNND